MAAEIELIVAAVTGALTGGAVKPLVAPADALAEHWKAKVRARLERVENSARRKTGTGLSVNDRVAYRVLSEAAFCDDAVVSEYLAGVIAGSSADSGDDGIPVLAQIGRLSAFQLRVHYILYRAWVRSGVPLGSRLFLSKSGLERAFMERFDLLGPRLSASASWFRKEGLLFESASSFDGYGHDDSFRLTTVGDVVIEGGGEIQPRIARQPTEPGLVFKGTLYGVDLLRWATASCVTSTGFEASDLERLEFDPPLPACAGTRIEDLPDIPLEAWRAARFPPT